MKNIFKRGNFQTYYFLHAHWQQFILEIQYNTFFYSNKEPTLIYQLHHISYLSIRKFKWLHKIRLLTCHIEAHCTFNNFGYYDTKNAWIGLSNREVKVTFDIPGFCISPQSMTSALYLFEQGLQ